MGGLGYRLRAKRLTVLENGGENMGHAAVFMKN